jgi:hypothetical protein
MVGHAPLQTLDPGVDRFQAFALASFLFGKLLFLSCRVTLQCLCAFDKLGIAETGATGFQIGLLVSIVPFSPATRS